MSDAVVIEDYLQWFLQTTFAKATLDIASSAIQVFMWFYSLSIYLRSKQDERQARNPFLFVSLLILLLSISSSIVGGISIYNILLDVVRGKEHALDGFIAAQYRIDAVWLKGDLLWNIAIWIADGLLVYRCYIVWYDRIWVSVPVLVLYLVGVGISIRNHIPLSYYDVKPTKAVDTLLLVILNVVIAVLISARLIRAHRRMAKLSPLTTSSEYLSVVAIMVESAAPLALMGIPLAITLFMKDSVIAWRIAEVLETTFKAFAILSPQMIIFRVATGTSWANTRESSRVVSAEIHFAPGAHHEHGKSTGYTSGTSHTDTTLEYSAFASHLSSATQVEEKRVSRNMDIRNSRGSLDA